MNTLSHDKLKQCLLEVGYPNTLITEKTVEHLLALKGKAAEMLADWMETGRVAKFEAIEGIDKSFLRDKLKMKDPAIIMAYGMLHDNPKYNAMLLKKKAAQLNSK